MAARIFQIISGQNIVHEYENLNLVKKMCSSLSTSYTALSIIVELLKSYYLLTTRYVGELQNAKPMLDQNLGYSLTAFAGYFQHDRKKQREQYILTNSRTSLVQLFVSTVPSHVFPWYSSLHSHTNDSSVGEHIPLFLQGEESHGPKEVIK